MQAELENNIDSLGNEHDIMDDSSLASNMHSGNKKGNAAAKSQAGGSKAVSDRADTKVLEWTSFAPKIIRQKYVARLQVERAQQAK